MPKVYNKRDKDCPKDAVYVGRPTKFGNPFIVGKDGSRDEVVHKFKQAVFSNPAFIERVGKELKGKDLICWCAPKACHADVLLEIANAQKKD
jgi:hypothetical protein